MAREPYLPIMSDHRHRRYRDGRSHGCAEIDKDHDLGDERGHPELFHGHHTAGTRPRTLKDVKMSAILVIFIAVVVTIFVYFRFGVLAAALKRAF
jgi:hypothetical protein